MKPTKSEPPVINKEELTQALNYEHKDKKEPSAADQNQVRASENEKTIIYSPIIPKTNPTIPQKNGPHILK